MVRLLFNQSICVVPHTLGLKADNITGVLHYLAKILQLTGCSDVKKDKGGGNAILELVPAPGQKSGYDRQH